MPPLTLSLPQLPDGDNSQYIGDSVVLRLETATVEEMNSLIGNQGFWGLIMSLFVSNGLLNRLNRQFRHEPNERHIIYPLNTGRGFERSAPTSVDVRINKSSNLGSVRDWFEAAGDSVALDRTTSYHDNVTIGQILEAAKLEQELRSLPRQSPTYQGLAQRLQRLHSQRIPVSRWRVGAPGPTHQGPDEPVAQAPAPIPPQQAPAPAPIVINHGIPSLDQFMSSLNDKPERQRAIAAQFKENVIAIQETEGAEEGKRERCFITLDDIILNKNSDQKFIMIVDSQKFKFLINKQDTFNNLQSTGRNPNNREIIHAIAIGTFAELLDLMKKHVPESDKGDPFWETGVATLEATPGSPTNKPH